MRKRKVLKERVREGFVAQEKRLGDEMSKGRRLEAGVREGFVTQEHRLGKEMST